MLSEDWIALSTADHSPERPGGYTFMWWRYEGEDLGELGAFSALGVGGQSIDVVPGAEMVFVNRTDTLADENVRDFEREDLIRSVLAARVGEPAETPELAPLEPLPARAVAEVPLEVQRRYLGRYDHPYGEWAEIYEPAEGTLALRASYVGGQSFDLEPLAEKRSWIVDAGATLEFEPDPEAPNGWRLLQENLMLALALRHAEEDERERAIALLGEVLERFPESRQAMEIIDRLLEDD